MLFPLLLAQGDVDGVLAQPWMRLVVKYHPAGARYVGGIGNGEDPAILVMDDVDAEHLRIPVPRASGA